MSISISKKLESLNLSYPIWLFDVDQPPWPRKLSRLLPGSRPAQIMGWFPWAWEYGTALYRIDDPMPAGVINTRPRDLQRLGDIVRVLESLRYDDRFEAGTFDVVFEPPAAAVEGQPRRETRGLDEWVFEEGHQGYIDPRAVVRIKRKWDDVPFWDREDCWNLFDDGMAQGNTSYGMASLVHDERELIVAAGIHRRETGEAIRKAEFEFVDGDKAVVKGIVFPKRYQTGRGLFLKGGPRFLDNRELLVDTALEGAPWNDVENYVRGNIAGPLRLQNGT